MAISFQSHQPFGYAEVIDGLRDTEQRRYNDHSASTAFEERRRTLVLKRFAVQAESIIIFTRRYLHQYHLMQLLTLYNLILRCTLVHQVLF